LSHGGAVRIFLAVEAERERECKRDREIVLTAVRENGGTLLHAADEFKSDREIVLAAVRQNKVALEYAAEDLLLDGTFAAYV